MNKYSVLLQYPYWCHDRDGPQTIFLHVSAHTVEAAIEEATKQAATQELTLDDFHTLLVIEGWHMDLNA